MKKFLITFLVLLIAVPLFSMLFGVDFKLNNNFWEFHGVFFLIFITAFPRLTLLFSSVLSGGILWWLGLIFAPRFLVAILATINFWHTNKILVTLSWIIALGGEAAEKYGTNYVFVHRKQKRILRRNERGEYV